jgi:hypothetical protein
MLNRDTLNVALPPAIVAPETTSQVVSFSSSRRRMVMFDAVDVRGSVMVTGTAKVSP